MSKNSVIIKAEEIRKKTGEEILKNIKDLKEELQKLRFRKVTDEIENPRLMRFIRKNIARLETISRERQMKEAADAKKKVQPK
jgi:large subunit ribosomal protein L29